MTPPTPRYYVSANDTVHAALEGRIPTSAVGSHPGLPPGSETLPHAVNSTVRHGAFVAHVGLLTLRYGARLARDAARDRLRATG